MIIDPTGVPGRVVVVEPTGSETQLNARIGNNPITAIFRERITLSPGEAVSMLPDLSRAHVFDSETGLRLER
jgi:multiple sugar transport system ATP-binding protein